MSNTVNHERFGELVALLFVIAISACDSVTAEECLAYACVNEARLTGEVEQPEGTELVDARFCSDAIGCVEGLVDLRELDSGEVCTGNNPEPYAGRVCFSRASEGGLSIEAALSRTDDGTVPKDGETYTLRVVDHDSEVVLVESQSSADYEITRQDNCHVCWAAEMSL
ncbi:MAG TPA: hypothetical protein VJN18_15190 [Polyangiaceae bacterium]|nr:hypothetical protein [Polyangiaceae bacterium]